MPKKLAQQAVLSELMSPPHLAEVLKTLEYFGIYQRFECIKCRQTFATINLALAHLRGEYLECKKGSVSKITPSQSEKEVFAPRKPSKLVSPKNAKKEVTPLLKSKRKSRYSLKQVEMILNKKKKDNVFAKQFGITTRDVAKLRYTWKKHSKYKNLLLKVPTPENIVAITKHVKNPHKYIKTPGKYKKPYKINKSANGANDYKVESAEEVPQ